MHILFLSHYFPPEVNAPATRTYQHCRRWVEAGHRVTVVTCVPNCPRGVPFDGYRNVWRKVEEVDGIKVVRVWTLLSRNEGFARRIANYLSYLVTATWFAIFQRDVDVVVATSPQFFCGWAGVLCKWIRRWPFVLEIRDIWPESIVTVGAMKRSWKIRILEWLERRMYAAANHIVTVGDGYRIKLLERNVPSERITVVPNGVALSSHRPHHSAESLRRRFDAEGKFICSYVGTVGMAHGLEVVLDAAEKLRAMGRHSVKFWIVGDGAERERLAKMALDRKLENVTFVGLVAKQLVADILACSDACLVHLRGTELFGTVIPSKIFEIMEASVPIIMGVRGEACDIVLKANAGIPMTPDDADSLVACIDRLRESPAEFREGQAYVAEHYNRDDLAERMLRAIERQLPSEAADLLPVFPIRHSDSGESERRRAA